MRRWILCAADAEVGKACLIGKAWLMGKVPREESAQMEAWYTQPATITWNIPLQQVMEFRL